MVAVAAAAGAQSAADWQATHERVNEIVRDVTVDGRDLVTTVARYEPDEYIIHPDNIDIDFPVERSRSFWRERLTDLQFEVLREEGTEPAFSNSLYDEEREGIYYSRATGQPLFHSRDKYTSNTGWPSFTKPIAPDAVAYRWDNSLFTRRVEVVDSLSGSHIGHVFQDGPDPTGQRFCMNSAALIFVPAGEEPPELVLPRDEWE